MTGQAIILVIALGFFLKDRRNNWPYLLAAASFLAAEGLKVWLTGAKLIDPLTRFTGELSRGWAFAVGFLLLLAILAMRLRPNFSPSRLASA